MVPYFHAFLGPGYRLDHMPLLLSQRPGAEGFHLHGGPMDSKGNPDFFLQYRVQQGTVRTTLLAAAIQLTDVGPGDGGFCVLKGSHKANFKVPASIEHGLHGAAGGLLHQPVTQAGDVVLWSEATTHGSLARAKGTGERRTALYRFAPAGSAYARSYAPAWPAAMLEGLSEGERAVMEPPYNVRLDRPFITGDGTVERNSRADKKKAFDKTVFKSTYF